MDEQTKRLDHLERQVQRLRRAVNVLAVSLIALLGAFAIGAAQEQPQELTLRKLTIVDEKGKGRILAHTLPNGYASIGHFDRYGKLRIAAATLPNGQSNIEHYDRDGKRRITVGTTPDGQATIQHNDGAEKTRIVAGTFPDGAAGIGLVDHKGTRIWGEASK
jgi:hypothetical protein